MDAKKKPGVRRRPNIDPKKREELLNSAHDSGGIEINESPESEPTPVQQAANEANATVPNAATGTPAEKKEEGTLSNVITLTVGGEIQIDLDDLKWLNPLAQEGGITKPYPLRLPLADKLKLEFLSTKLGLGSQSSVIIEAVQEKLETELKKRGLPNSPKDLKKIKNIKR